MEKKDIIMQEYLQYRFNDLEIEQESQAAKANNITLSPAVRMEGLLRLEVIETALQVFMTIATAGHDATRMTVSEAICTCTGKTPQQLSATGARRVVQSANGALDKAIDVGVESVRTGANWLGKKLVAWTENK